MPAPLSGPGIGLPLPQALYPTALLNAPVDASTNSITLAPGDALPIPAGDWYISLGSYLVLQYLDPVTGTWTATPGTAFNRGLHFIKSDGFTVRVANLLGCVVGAVVTSYGTGYVQATTSVAVTGPSGVAVSPIVGGQLTASVSGAGAGYGVAPIVILPAPPPPASNPNGVGGIPASGYAVIASGTVSGFTFTNPGAGYPSGFTVTALPNPTDPNINVGITNATIVFSTAGSGSITGALVTNSGAPMADAVAGAFGVTLAISGAGTSATIAPVILQTIKSVSVTGSGTGYGSVGLAVGVVGGAGSLGTITNSPQYLGLSFIPRPPNVSLPSITAQGLGTVYDGGLFLSPPTGFITGPQATGASVTVGTIALTMGSRPDIVTLQPAP